MWASGDFGVIAALIQPVAEQLADSADLVAGSRVLDVAGGTGNMALAAARCGCDVTCTDYVPELLERGRERAQAERFGIEFAVADAEALPYADGSYDAVAVRVRRDVRARPAQGGRRARARLPPGRADRARQLDARGLPRRAGSAPRPRHVPPPAGVASPLLLGQRGGHRRPAGRRRRAPSARAGAPSRGASGRGRSSSPPCATGTARR